jgi:hypothetical protein
MKAWMITVAVLGAGSAATAAPKPPPAIVAAALAELGDESGPRAKPLPGMFKALDISRDGVPDWLVDYSGDNAFCGSGGCRIVLHVSRPDGGHQVVFDELQRGYRFARRGGRAEFEVGLYGGFCGQAGNYDCRRRFAWDEASARLVERPNSRGDTVLTGPLFQTVPADLASRTRAADARLCRQASASPEPEVASVPDLDGDGARDWVLQGDFCVEGGPRRTRVLLTSQPDGVALNLPGDDYALDIAASPAVFLAPNGACVTRVAPCAYRRYRWDAELGRFEVEEPAAIRR